ncbi:MAG: peptidoglycan DD-metalloendopeptidase family protein [Planctomycetota bacterium]|nr:MAG: peptidoglycan DD-metalloendopeptidase family protein [Planctomycetota bacterium]
MMWVGRMLLGLVTIAVFSGAGLADTGVKGSEEESVLESGADHTRYEQLNRMIRGYSQQRIFCLDINEEYTFELKSGLEKVIRLVSVKEFSDSVLGRIRRAEVKVEINGKPLGLICAPYVMPTESDGIRIQADAISGWRDIPKKIQFSIWDSADPVVNADRFGFPIDNYLLFSHGIQCYNEVVHLGGNDGDPKGPNFHHDYGIDLAGYIGRDEIVSCTDGEVTLFWPSREKLCSVAIKDDNGIFWEYGHLDSVMPNIRKGVRVRKGQKIGMLGKSGPSGNFSHLHLGNYLSKAGLDKDTRNRRLNLYPWIVTAYHEQYHKNLYAVARPHHVVSTGEEVVFDGLNSLALGTKIVSYRWVFHDGEEVNDVRAEKTFDSPGVYIATLWVKDEKGAVDADFCKVKVFTKSAPEDRIPTIFMTHAPSKGIIVDQPVYFRIWMPANKGTHMTIDFGDGTVIDDYVSDSEVSHKFNTPGIHIMTAKKTIDGKPIMQKQKVVVNKSRKIKKSKRQNIG